MNSPTALLVILIALVLFAAFVADFSVGLWDRFNSAMRNATRNINAIGSDITATYTEPWINPRWGADQMYPVLMFIIWIVLLAVIALVAEALRERREGDDE
jgi:NADH:ubiquinone oxidoreductase subunit 6 (subunit J)